MTYYDKNKSRRIKYAKEYYREHREEILEKMQKEYWNVKKKTPKCKICGKKLPKELTAHTKYCDQCLYSRGHGEDAHRMAAVRWYRKNHLTKKEKTGSI
jgi:hypothetical protein